MQRGKLYQDGKHICDVDYSLTSTERHTLGDIRGTIQPKAYSLYTLFNDADSYTLHMADGKCLNIILSNSEGEFMSDGGPYDCSA